MPPKLAAPWLDYRTRRAALIVGVAGLVLWAGGIGTALGVLVASDVALSALAAVWLTGSLWALVRFALFQCPYCSKRFHVTASIANPFASACLHCGFAKWRDPHAGRAFTRQ